MVAVLATLVLLLLPLLKDIVEFHAVFFCC